MKRFQRGLAILLSACMIGGMMPLPASAEETVSENIIQTESTENTENLENAQSENEKHEGIEITFNSNGFGNCPEMQCNRISACC